jgi:hypothetical protein
MNEQEVKSGKKSPTCSVTQRSCRCGDSGRCESRLGEPVLDAPAKEAVRWLRSARLYLDAAKVALDSAAGGEELLVRKYPAPEIREVRRKVVTAIALIDEIGGEL